MQYKLPLLARSLRLGLTLATGKMPGKFYGYNSRSGYCSRRSKMKKLGFCLSLLWAVLLLVSPAALADMEISIGNEQDVITIKSNGELLAPNGVSFGQIDGNGDILNSNGDRIATLDGNGNLLDPQGNSVVTIDEDGNILDGNGDRFASVQSNGDILNSQGDLVGSVSNCCSNSQDSRHAAAVLLLLIAASNSGG